MSYQKFQLRNGLTHAVEPDQVGELWVRGPQVFAGYGGAHHEKAASATARVLRDGWLATGDIASMDENGFFTIIDRKENMVIRNGQRIFPRQIEEVLYDHPAIELAHVRREQDETGAVYLHARVKLHRNLAATEEELKKYCAKRLHPNALPDTVTFDPPNDQAG